MIVVDASVLVDLFCDHPAGARVEAEISRTGGEMHAPHLVDAEVGHGLRGLLLGGKLSEQEARLALDLLRDADIVRYPHGPLLDRALDLRSNATFYDALYLVLAEALDAPLLTSDVALRSVPGCAARVIVIER